MIFPHFYRLISSMSLLLMVDTYAATADALFNSVALTPNEYNVATAVNSLGQDNTQNQLYVAVASLTSPDDVKKALNNLSGEIHASLMSGLIFNGQYSRNILLNRLAKIADDKYIKNPYARFQNNNVDFLDLESQIRNSEFWLEGYGSSGNLSGNYNASPFVQKNYGVFIGNDIRFGTIFKIGLTAGYGGSAFSVDDLNSFAKSDNYFIGLYGSAEFTKFGVRLGIVDSWYEMTTKRDAVFPGINDFLQSSYNPNAMQLFAEGVYKFYLGPRVQVEPLAQFAYINLQSIDFYESGGPSALNGYSAKDSVEYSVFGTRFNVILAQNQLIWRNRSLIGWQHTYGDINPVASFVFPDSIPFSVAGAPLIEDALVINSSLNVTTLDERFNLSLGYYGQFGINGRDNGAQLSVSWRFA